MGRLLDGVVFCQPAVKIEGYMLPHRQVRPKGVLFWRVRFCSCKNEYKLTAGRLDLLPLDRFGKGGAYDFFVELGQLPAKGDLSVSQYAQKV